MIKIKSNINSILKTFKERQSAIKNINITVAKQVAYEIAKQIKSDIVLNKPTWYESAGGMSINYGTDVVVDETSSGALIRIGENTSKLIMADGSQINPYYFIEFGFGIIGANNSAANSIKYGWAYNIKGHIEPWIIPGSETLSSGTQGINFLYNNVYVNKDKWVSLAKQKVMEAFNV